MAIYRDRGAFVARHPRYRAPPASVTVMKVRLLGLLLFGLCAVAAWRLHQWVVAPPEHELATGELLLALLTAVCGHVGAALMLVGATLFEPIPDPARRPARGRML